MASIRTVNPVKLFISVLASDPSLIPEVRQRVVSVYGNIDHESSLIPFETGGSECILFSFDRLIDPEQLADIKRHTNQLEDALRLRFPAVSRSVNLDPGYIENAKVILASTKNFHHRIYLRSGIFAEVTMHFKQDRFQFFPWTHPSYQSTEYQQFFQSAREVYRHQLRSMCILSREEAL